MSVILLTLPSYATTHARTFERVSSTLERLLSSNLSTSRVEVDNLVEVLVAKVALVQTGRVPGRHFDGHAGRNGHSAWLTVGTGRRDKRNQK